VAQPEASSGADPSPVVTSRNPNRLIDETSPYLLQHAYNPVDWQPWDEGALDEARSKDKPILLSIGYAACHWCHVMERESFEDELIAKKMNEQFVCIKVDREERPDIDAVYMDAVQAMTGHGGWPMTMFLSPNGTPFYGGTYFPPEPRHGLPAFTQVLDAVSDAYRTRRDEVVSEGTRLMAQIAEQTSPRPSSEPLTNSLLSHAVHHLSSSFDPAQGGFGTAPKFPQAPVLEFVLSSASLDLGRSQEMIDVTLDRMAKGGIYDQIGGGFSRYSVDPNWLVPHFEKMLYDNAQLARIYLRAWQLRKRPLYRRVAQETLGYLIRDMSSPDGAFYASEDADSEGIEGRFYVWTFEEFMQLAPAASAYYGVTPAGNFEGLNILTAASDEPPGEARAALLAARSRRERPARDEKILASWNALCITALAEAGAAFEQDALIEAASRCCRFVLDRMVLGGRLQHVFKDGVAKVPAMLEDYAYLTEALLTLWEITFEPAWATDALRLTEQMIDLFWDQDSVGMFTTAKDHEKLILRQKEVVESATPAPNAVAAIVMQKLAILFDRPDLTKRADDILRLAHTYMARAPQATGTFLCALGFHLSTPKELVVLGNANDPSTKALLREVWSRYIPHKVLAGGPPGIDSPLLEGKAPLDGRPTAFVCENYSCNAPVTTAEELAVQLGG